jgi:hypothetical protein
MLGGDLDRNEVQPVWIEVQNGTSRRLWLLRSGIDPDYYSPREIAWSLHARLGNDMNAQIDRHFDELAFKNPVAPGETHEGIVFTNPQHRTKLLNVDLFGRRTLIPFTLFLPVPDDATDDGSLLFQYPEAELVDYTNLATFRAALERQVCCTARGDPLNVVLVGEVAAVGSAMVRRSYRRELRADDLAQQVFGRPPDFVLRKQAQGGAPSNWLRAWLAPIRFQGHSVYLAETGRPIGGRFKPTEASHVVLDNDVDEARNLLIQDMMYSGGLDKLGFVTGVGEVTDTRPRNTLDGARYYTDGLRAVLFFAIRPRSLIDVEFLHWEPYLDWSGEANEDARGEPGG